MKKSNKKTLVLSVVAFVLVLMSLISFTYSWIDDIKLIEFQNDDLVKNGAPLKTGVDINSTINITKANNTINLGNILQTGDISFQYKNGTAQQYSEADATSPTAATQHIKYDTDPTNPIKNPSRDDINEKKGYFYESGDMHLSPCYSDGETFYFPKGSGTYREGNKDDENVSYISFTAKVSSPDANIDFWFKTLPSITDQNNNSLNQYARYAIIVDGSNHVYSGSSNSDYKTYDPSSGTIKTFDTRSIAAYTYGNPANTNAQRGQNGNVLFSIKKGDTVNLTVKIWLENGCTATASNIDLQFSTSWGYTRDITIVDQTSSCKYITSNDTNSSWIGDKPLYLVAPGILDEMCAEKFVNPTVADWDDIKNVTGYEDAPFYDLRSENTDMVTTGTNSDGFTYFTVHNVPIVYNNEELMLFRCRKQGDDDDNESPYGWNTGNLDQNKRPKGVNCYNWWSTFLPDTYTDATYKLYGGSHDNFAKRYYSSSVDNKCETYQGYGTWGNLIKITVDGRSKALHWSDTTVGEGVTSGDAADNLAFKGNNNDSIDLYICDFSDRATSGEVYVHGMSYDSRSNVTDSNCWFAYVPESSTLLQFYYDRNNRRDYPRDYGRWGYNSWSGVNPQERPAGSTKYYFTHRIKHYASVNANHGYDEGSDGIGYWEGVDKVYLINNYENHLNETSIKANMYWNDGHNNYDPSKNDRNPVDVDMSDTETTHPSNSSWKIYSNSTVVDNNAGYYMYVKFKIGTTPGGDVPMCPGCYFDWTGDRWVGSLTGTGRGGGTVTPPSEPETPPSGDTTEITTNVPTAYGIYAYGNLSNNGRYEEYAEFSSTDVGGSIVLDLTAGGTYMFMIRKGPQNGWNQYGIGSGNSVRLSSGQSGTNYATYNFNTNGSQKLTMIVETTGRYEITISEDQNGSMTLQFAYISS